MKRITHIVIVFSLLTSSLLIFSCSDSERRLPFISKNATVVIILSMPDEQATISSSIIDRILRSITRDAIAQTAPATIIGYTVTVTALDMSALTQTFTATDTLALAVPVGNARRFQVTANVDPASASAALSFRGITTIDLAGGATVTVPVIMNLNETKIVIPDGGNTAISPGRIVMINNVADGSTTWIAKTTFTGFTGTLRPFDVDFDSRGRIYVANYSTPGIFRMDDINGTNFIQSSATIFGTGSALTFIRTIAVDRTNSLVYFALDNALYRSNLDGTGTQQLSLTGTGFESSSTYNIKGIDVDAEGMLYIVGPHDTFNNPPRLIRYNPTLQQIIGSPYSITNTTSPSTINISDVLYRSPYVYVANFAGSAGYQILQLTFSGSSFSLVASNGTKSTTQAPGNFYGASRFLAIRNDILIVADSGQGSAGSDYDQIVSFGNMSFTSWSAFGSYGTGTSQFKLYSQC